MEKIAEFTNTFEDNRERLYYGKYSVIESKKANSQWKAGGHF